MSQVEISAAKVEALDEAIIRVGEISGDYEELNLVVDALTILEVLRDTEYEKVKIQENV